MTGRHAHHFAKQPREVVDVLVAQLLGDLADALLALVEQAAGVGHLQLDEILDRCMAGQGAVGLGEVKT
ncbi:hypothetical protein D3C72_2213570 [compost metagenome]